MSADQLLSILSGTSPSGVATALTWVDREALLGVTGIPAEKDALPAFASLLGVDGALVDGSASWARDAADGLRSQGRACLWAVDGIVCRIARSRGWPETLRLCVDAAAWAPAVEAATMEAVNDVESAVSAGADAIVVADDLAGDEWLITPESASTVAEAYSALVESWRGLGPAVFHSDGDISTLMPALSAAGFSAIHFGLLDELALASAFRSSWRAGLCPVGGISATSSGAARLTRLARLSQEGPCVLSDDGGTCSEEDAARLAQAFATLAGLIGEK